MLPYAAAFRPGHTEYSLYFPTSRLTLYAIAQVHTCRVCKVHACNAEPRVVANRLLAEICQNDVSAYRTSKVPFPVTRCKLNGTVFLIPIAFIHMYK